MPRRREDAKTRSKQNCGIIFFKRRNYGTSVHAPLRCQKNKKGVVAFAPRLRAFAAIAVLPLSACSLISKSVFVRGRGRNARHIDIDCHLHTVVGLDDIQHALPHVGK